MSLQGFAQAVAVDAPDRVHSIVDQHDGDLLGIGVEQRRVIEDRPLRKSDIRIPGQHLGHDHSSLVAQMAAGLTQQLDAVCGHGSRVGASYHGAGARGDDRGACPK